MEAWWVTLGQFGDLRSTGVSTPHRTFCASVVIERTCSCCFEARASNHVLFPFLIYLIYRAKTKWLILPVPWNTRLSLLFPRVIWETKVLMTFSCLLDGPTCCCVHTSTYGDPMNYWLPVCPILNSLDLVLQTNRRRFLNFKWRSGYKSKTTFTSTSSSTFKERKMDNWT